MAEEKKKTAGKEGQEISYQNKDITSKLLAEKFKGKSFAVYGVDLPAIVSVEPTNLPAIEANELRMDNIFLLEDGSYLLVDYESKYDEANKVKYLGYIVRVSQRLYNEYRRYPQIRMLVIYTADVKRGYTSSVMDIGSNRFEITEAFLSEINTDEVWTRITSKVQQGQSPDSKEMMELIVYPLAFESRDEKQNAIGKVIGLVGMIKEDDVKRFVLKCLLVFTDKIILDEDAKRIEEALMVTKVEKLMYEKEAVRIAKNLLEDGFDVERVVKNTGLPIETITELYKNIAKEKQLMKN
ncbi:hypothetical protein [Butyrivibrio sp. AE2032]|uniref:hypothetical protein n=1 Tax=Butyrivibrio sp. AE2032 TaxID=1458463 RepID=UPI000690AA0F|nr:hypothetical protein [Butyrivibrio sp. AE2032]